MDVCDDADYSQMLKGYSDEAMEAGVPAITSAGASHILTSCHAPSGAKETIIPSSQILLPVNLQYSESELVLKLRVRPARVIDLNLLVKLLCLCLAGIYPGVSNLMAAHMVGIARREYTSDWTLTSHSRHAGTNGGPVESEESLPEALQGEAVEPERVRYTYYTAGSGGVGPTILETSFLLAGTDVVVYSNGEKVASTADHGF